MAFHEVLFPYPFEYGMTITHRYRTGIVTTQSLHEERVCNWLDCLREYAVTPVLIDRADFQTLGAFYRAREGRTHSFRLLDPIDNQVVEQSIGFGDGSRYIWKVYKQYATGLAGDSYLAKRPLFKLAAPTAIWVDNVIRTFPIIDMNLGLIYFLVSMSPISVTLTSPNKLTRNDGGNFVTQGFLVNDWFHIIPTGQTAIAGRIESFTDGGQSVLFVSGQGNVPFASQGPVNAMIRVPPTPAGPGVLGHVELSCTFHVPVHFTMNRLGTTHQTFEHYNPQGMTMIEDRLEQIFLDNDNIIEMAIPGFVESRYPFHEQLSEDSEFASRYSDQVITFDSGYEQRQTRSRQGYSDYSFKYLTKPIEEIQRVLAMYHCRKGQFTGFRLRDINDYQAIQEFIGNSNGEIYSFQLVKGYESGSEDEQRTINKPVQGTVTLYGNTVPLVSSTDHFIIDYSTGIVYFTLGTIDLEFITSGNILRRLAGSWITDGVEVNDRLSIPQSVSNNRLWRVATVSSATDLVLASVVGSEPVVDETLLSATVYTPPLTGTEYTWSGEFDIGVRFNSDELQVSIQGFEPYDIDNLGFQEIHTAPITPIYYEPPPPATSSLLCATVASPIMSTPEIAVDLAAGSLSMTYTERPGHAEMGYHPRPGEIHNTMRGMTGFTAFVVLSHVRRGVVYDICQPCEFSGYNTINDAGIRLLIIDNPSNANEAIVQLQSWCGSVSFEAVFNPLLNRYVRQPVVEEVRRCTFSRVPLFTSLSSVPYPGTVILIASLSYESQVGYLSGTCGEKLPSIGLRNFSSTVIVDTATGSYEQRKVGKYQHDDGLGTLFYPSQFGRYKGNLVGHIPTGDPLGRCYEFFWAQHYGSYLKGMDEVFFKHYHNALIGYLEAKYFYKVQTALALEGTRGHFISHYDTLYKFNTGETVAEMQHHLPFTPTDQASGERVSLWKSEVSGALQLVDAYGAPSVGHFGPQVVNVDPTYQFIEAPLKGFWEGD